jgi:hypothetical protein
VSSSSIDEDEDREEGDDHDDEDVIGLPDGGRIRRSQHKFSDTPLSKERFQAITSKLSKPLPKDEERDRDRDREEEATLQQKYDPVLQKHRPVHKYEDQASTQESLLSAFKPAKRDASREKKSVSYAPAYSFGIRRLYKMSEHIDSLKDKEGRNTARSMLLELFYRFMKRFIKGFAIAYIGKATLSFLGLLIRTRMNLNKMRSGVARVVIGDPIRYGATLGTYIAVFESVMRLSRYTSESGVDNRSMSQRTIIAGAVAGLSIFAMPADTRTTIALFFFVRALEVLARYYSQKHPDLVPEIIQDNAAPIVMGIASAQTAWGMYMFCRLHVCLSQCVYCCIVLASIAQY